MTSKVLLFVLSVLSFANLAAAEEFTLTRGFDNRTFYCTDSWNGGGQQTTRIQYAECTNLNGSTKLGQVIGANLQAQCKELGLTQNVQGKLANLSVLNAPANSVLVCNCTNLSGQTSFGQVSAGSDEPETLRSTCKQLALNQNSYGAIRGCQIL